jgi:hypothetical protein
LPSQGLQEVKHGDRRDRGTTLKIDTLGRSAGPANGDRYIYVVAGPKFAEIFSLDQALKKPEQAGEWCLSKNRRFVGQENTRGGSQARTHGVKVGKFGEFAMFDAKLHRVPVRV